MLFLVKIYKILLRNMAWDFTPLEIQNISDVRRKAHKKPPWTVGSSTGVLLNIPYPITKIISL